MKKKEMQRQDELYDPTISHSRRTPLMSINTCTFFFLLIAKDMPRLEVYIRMAYIEENLKIRSRPREDSDEEDRATLDPQEELYSLADKWKVEKQKPINDGNVTNSMQMLTAIPEVDLGME